MPSPLTVTVYPASRVQGHVRPPGDKSISHRYALLCGARRGTSTIRLFHRRRLPIHAELPLCAGRFGRVDAGTRCPSLRITGRGLGGLSTPPVRPSTPGNSGSTMRMLAGVLAAQPFVITISGHDSFSRRPMRRIIVPLERMGARIRVERRTAAADHRGPAPPPSDRLRARCAKRAGQERGPPGRTPCGRRNPGPRNGCRRATIRSGRCGVRRRMCTAAPGRVSIEGGQRLSPQSLYVPGDISSAAFWMVAAAALSGSEDRYRPSG